MGKTNKKKYNWNPKARPERNQKILKLRKEGYSYRAIGKIFHLSHARIKEIVDDLGVRT